MCDTKKVTQLYSRDFVVSPVSRNFCKSLEGCLRVTQNDLTIIKGDFRFSCFQTLLELVGRPGPSDDHHDYDVCDDHG